MHQPVGIFDSGLGGLTVARAVKSLLPQESLVYFGDTAYLPYGDKTACVLQGRVLQITSFLLQQRCKAILIACHSASAVAYDVVRAYVGPRAIVLNVIDPMITYLGHHFSGQTVGLIGTKQTVESNVYTRKSATSGALIHFRALPTPLLAPMVEANFLQGDYCKKTLHSYLRHSALQHLGAFVLGCTHYSFIKKDVEAFYQHAVEVLDAAPLIAQRLRHLLAHHQLLNTTAPAKDLFFASSPAPPLAAATQAFFGQLVCLKQLPVFS